MVNQTNAGATFAVGFLQPRVGLKVSKGASVDTSEQIKPTTNMIYNIQKSIDNSQHIY
jgi:hypothetical protein